MRGMESTAVTARGQLELRWWPLWKSPCDLTFSLTRTLISSFQETGGGMGGAREGGA